MESIHFDHSTNSANKKNEIFRHIVPSGSYSMRFLLHSNGIPRSCLFTAIKKTMELFNEAGINVRHHFKKMFVVNGDATLTYVDWVLTQRAFNLVMKHCTIIKVNGFLSVN